jgi:hypothetical protein
VGLLLLVVALVQRVYGPLSRARAVALLLGARLLAGGRAPPRLGRGAAPSRP